VQANRIRTHDLVMLNACGGGLTWGANLVRW
jgi:3-oxoacyl-[acyl-carrier-protein] synthase III